MPLSEKEIFDKINLQSDCRKIAEEYICKYYGDLYTLDEAMKIAKYLMLELPKNPNASTKDFILNGYYDDIIINRGKMIVARSKSIKNDTEDIIEIKLKTKKELISKDKLKRLIAGLVATVSIASVFALRFNNNYEELKEATTIKLGQLASDDYVNKTTILAQNSMPTYDALGNYISLSEGVASDILNVCIKDPTLFDVTIYDTYYSISSNRLDNFNNIWYTLKTYMANDEAFSPLYAKIANQSFLGYVLEMLTKRGDVIHYMPEYQKCANIVDEYAKVGSYDALSKESHVVLREMMDKYEELGKELYKTNKKTINNLVEEEKELGGR